MILIRREIHWGMNASVLTLLSFKGITPKVTEIISLSHFPFLHNIQIATVLMNIFLHSWPAKTLYYFLLDKYLTLGIHYFHHFLQHFVLRAEHKCHKAAVAGASNASYGWAWLLSDRAFSLEEHTKHIYTIYDQICTHTFIYPLLQVSKTLCRT